MVVRGAIPIPGINRVWLNTCVLRMSHSLTIIVLVHSIFGIYKHAFIFCPASFHSALGSRSQQIGQGCLPKDHRGVLSASHPRFRHQQEDRRRGGRHSVEAIEKQDRRICHGTRSACCFPVLIRTAELGAWVSNTNHGRS